MDGGFNGPVYPVNPRRRRRPVGPRLQVDPGHSEGPVDLAVIVVPAKLTMAAARECAQKGVHGMVVITAGFAETGPAGK
jgi:acyl-CoA synthetase (NDP forming)